MHYIDLFVAKYGYHVWSEVDKMPSDGGWGRIFSVRVHVWYV